MMAGAQFIRAAYTAPEYSLLESSPVRHGGRFPALVVDRQSQVPVSGELYDVSDKELGRLDRYELDELDIPGLYRRERIALDDQSSAWAYVAHPTDAEAWTLIRSGRWEADRKMADSRELISAAKRKSLPEGKFALPEERKYPIDTAARVRNAAARLEQQKGSMPAAKYAKAKAAIARAAKKFGIDSKFNKPKQKRLRVQADLGHGGSLHVTHMSEPVGGQLAEFCGLIELADGSAKTKAPVWIQIAKYGHFEGHSSGPFTLDDKTFDDIVRNFKATSNRRIPIDFEHASEADPTDGSIPIDGAPAQGWILDLQKRADGLWGLVEWLEPARQYIEQGKYKYFSPAIRFNSRDRVTGKPIGARMTSGALTNSPFLDGMHSVAAKDLEPEAPPVALSMAYSTHEYMPKIKAALRLHELTPPGEVKNHFTNLREMLTAAGGDHEAVHQGVVLGDYLKPMREMTGAGMGSTWEQVLDIVEDMIDAAIDEHNLLYHSGQEPEDEEDEADMTDRDPADPQETQAMDTISLKDHETAVASLTLRLKDAESKQAALEAENKALKDDAEKRAAAALDARVGEAFDAYKDAMKLTDDNRKQMSITLKSDPELFEKLYPKTTPAQAHLLRRVAGQGDSRTSDVTPIPTIKTLTDKYLKDGKSIEEATSLAFTEVTRFAANH